MQVSLKTPRETHSDQLRRTLEEEIIAGTIRPGTRLDEQRLADRFQISRTPVREALRQLAASGLVEWRPRQGAIVATLTFPELVEMFEVMAAIEGLCGRLAARRMTDAERRELLAIHRQSEQAVKADDRAAYHSLNRPFHEAIYRGSHNRYLCAQASTLFNRLSPYRGFQLRHQGRLQSSFEEHERIVQAIVTGGAEAASQLLRSHVELHGEVLGDLVSTFRQAESRRLAAQ